MKLLIIDLGGQYCHLIKRTLDDIRIASDIRGPSISPDEARQYRGIILSGGPLSVYEAGSPTIDDRLLELGLPILGICYGHHLLATMLGGTVGVIKPEYGDTTLTVQEPGVLFDGTSQSFKVWMSHGDVLMVAPEGVTINATTSDCPNAAFSHNEKQFYGVQFHLEVMHTDFGPRILQNFVNLCGVDQMPLGDRIAELTTHIRNTVGDRKVFFFVSGGVDSTVAFVLCAKALRPEQLLGIYVDTGFMRRNEQHDVIDCFDRIGFSGRLVIKSCSQQFMTALVGVIDPEEKRQIIGRLFVDVEQAVMTEWVGDDWMLGQGTIYPDIIESGSGSAAKIKTHHNRCAEIQELIAKGRVIEPLRDFYKDQVREIGRDLGIPPYFVERWPFPGPGLAIRCLCTADAGVVTPITDWVSSVFGAIYQGVHVPLRSVGVQGDARTYRTTMAVKGPLSKYDLTALARQFHQDRIIAHVAGAIDLKAGKVVPATLTPERIAILREADNAVRSAMIGWENLCWQFPVVLIPLSFRRGETIVLRPVSSRDGMTANFVIPPKSVLKRIVDDIMAIQGVDAVFLDVSDKPPATIEWE